MASGGTRLLIATGEAAASEDELPPLVRALIDRASEVLVMTPALVSRLQWLASDTGRARFEADERLSTVLGHLDTLAPEANISGRIGDDTPFTAFSDAVREFLPDHILIALRSSDHSGWQERRLLDQIGEFGIPMTHLRARPGGAAADQDIARHWQREQPQQSAARDAARARLARSRTGRRILLGTVAARVLHEAPRPGRA